MNILFSLNRFIFVTANLEFIVYHILQVTDVVRVPMFREKSVASMQEIPRIKTTCNLETMEYELDLR
jgi:hypothetical protein